MKKVLSALLIMLMLIQTVSFAANKVYSEEETRLLVERLNTLGIFEQFDDELFFGDNANVKRSEAAVVISNMLGMKGSSGDSSTEIKFYDVPQYVPYINSVNYVGSLGIMSGNNAGLFLPDDPMEVAHVYKALVVALGYKWKAEAYGGYPAGYVKVAAELEIADVISKGINETATRLDLLKMVEVALDAPICRMKSISGDVMDFEIDEDVTVLSEYHNIYFDEGVVENNKSMNISSTPEIDEDVVFIDGRKLYVDGVTSVYANFGYKVEYYYRYDKHSNTNYLLTVTSSDENTETKIARTDFDNFADGKITYYNEDGKEKNIKLSSSVAVLYNGEATTNVATAINSFEGTLTVIDNDADRQADVIIAKNYTYDKVKSINVAENKIYAGSKVFNLDSYEAVDVVVAESGEPIELATIGVDNIIGYATSVDGSKLMIDVLGSAVAVKVKSLSQDKFVTDEGKEYSMELLRPEHKAMIKPNTAVFIVVVDGYYGVWVSVASETVSTGYLINVAVDSDIFGETKIIGARMLDVDGTIKALKPANEKKMILNGKLIDVSELNAELARIKAEYQLGGDGAVSQLICYKLNDDGNLSHIYTVNREDENSPLYLKYGFSRDGLADFYSNSGYGTPRFKSQDEAYVGKVKIPHGYYTHNYMITGTHPIFLVPETDQMAADEDWYNTKAFSPAEYQGITSVMIETFTKNDLDIVPKAMVRYLPETENVESFNVYTHGTLVLVDSAYQTLDNDGGVDYIVSGLSKGKTVKYGIDNREISAESIDVKKAIAEDHEEETGFTTGDIAVVQLDSLNRILQIEKIYDRETGNINPRIAAETATTQTCALILHTYNKPDDGYGLEFFEKDLTQGVPNNKRKLLISLHAMGLGRVNESAKTFMFYDDSEEKVYLGSTQNVVDYQQDPVNYTRIFAIHRNSEMDIVFYNK